MGLERRLLRRLWLILADRLPMLRRSIAPDFA
jgi:hypothetical protein